MNASGPLRLGFAAGSVDITPASEVGGSIYCKKNKHLGFERICDRFEANAVLLRNGDCALLLIQLDAFLIGRRLREELLVGVHGALADVEVIMMASHSHCAPNLDPSLPVMGDCCESYFQSVLEKLIRLVDALLQATPVIVIIRLGEGHDSAQSINRRDKRWYVRRRPPFLAHQVDIFPNPDGVRDPSLRALEIVDADNPGRTRAVLWNYACHPVSFPLQTCGSTDFPGRVRERLRQHVPQDTVVLFLPGFMGNIRPRILSHAIDARSLLRGRLGGPLFGAFSLEAWHAWADSIGEDLLGILQHENREHVTGQGMGVGQRSLTINEFRDGDIDDKVLRFFHVRVGDNFQALFISAEPVIEYHFLLKAALGPDVFLMTCGYLDETFGYLPTSDMLNEGGYEVSGFRANYMRQGTFRSELTEIVLRGFPEAV